MSVCKRNRERRKQVYNPVGIMQTARKRLADSRITLAIVAERAAGRGQKREKERVAYFSANLTGLVIF